MDRIEKLLAFLKDSPGDSFLKHALALEYIKKGVDEQAARLFGEILQAEPSYVGSYYHYGKLLERAGDENAAVDMYQKGIEEARKAGDRHAAAELQGALDELVS